MENRNSILDLIVGLLKLLLELVFTIVRVLITIIGALFDLLRTLFSKTTTANGFEGKKFNKEQFVNYIKSHKKGVLLAVIVVGVLLIMLENLFYTPPSMDYNDSYNSSYNYSNHYVDDDCDECYGTGDCNFCNGSGIVRSYGVEVECKGCDGWGNCFRCDGTGDK